MLESEIQKANKGNLKGYADKARSLVFNLLNKKNQHLRLRLLLNRPVNGLEPLSPNSAVTNPKSLAPPTVIEEKQKLMQN